MSNLFFEPGPARKRGCQKVMLATTAYDSPDASYTASIAQSRTALDQAGIQSAYLLLAGNCHVDDARNAVCMEFLSSDCTDLVSIDADVSWEPESLVKLCQADGDLVGGVYPYRREGVETMPVRMLPGIDKSDERGLLEVEGLPAGFMRMRRHVLETLCRNAVKFIRRGKEYYLLFERTLEDGERYSGDISFCRKWRAQEGKVHALVDLRLGHVTKAILRDSLGANLRRNSGESLAYVADRIRRGVEDPNSDYHEAFKYVDNHWAAAPETLAVCTMLARSAKGPIIETGSGLSTVLMAAANPAQEVYCLEHIDYFGDLLHGLAREASVSNITLVRCKMKDDWYDIERIPLPDKFALGICDGPPRQFGSRMKFFDVFGERCDVLAADDADDFQYAEQIRQWASAHGRAVVVEGRAALVTKINAQSKAA